jgi:hypothetical protein
MKVSAIVVAGLLSFPFSNASAQSVNDAQIASIVVTANQVDIDAGKLAKSRSTNKEVKDFAELMITDHTGVNKSAKDLVKVVDATLRVDTPRGPVWHRYQGDGYGEHADGRPFDGTGVGRAWPLLTGERAHYELAAGRRDVAKQLADALEALAGESGLLPEQVWDSADIPDRGLFIGHPSGSAMPLVWAHAEYVKLCRSLQEREVFDRPPQTVQRYLVEKVTSRHVIWRFNNKVRAMPPGRTLRLETLAPAVVRWSFDGWRTIQDVATRDTTLGVHVADLETPCLAIGERVDFTLYWPDAHRWEGADFVVWVERPFDSTMAGQFIAVPALDRVRDAVEDHVRPRVEQDEMAS